MTELPGRVRRRLVDLADRWSLPSEAERQLAALLLLVADDALAPTTVRAPEQAVEIHVADSLTGLTVNAIHSAARLVDIGAGAGFPGLVLAAALPDAQVTLLESSSRKCDFLRRAATATGIANAEVVHARAEEWRDGFELSDVATARAVAPLAVLAEYAAPLVRVGGALVAWKGRRDPAEEEGANAAAATLGLSPAPPLAVEPGPGAEHRHLYVVSKTAPTPATFPRRAGVARKRPLV